MNPALLHQNGEELLNEMFTQWNNFKTFLNFLRKAFFWLDQYVLPIRKDKLDKQYQFSLANIGYEVLSEKLKEFLSTRFFATIEEFLARERRKEQVPRIKIQRSISVILYYLL
jgi:hypothetical protein